MTLHGLPSGLIPSGSSLEFTLDTLPDALQREHALGGGRWGILHVLEGSLVYVDLVSGDGRPVAAPGSVVIAPQRPHKVTVSGPVRCRIDFFREPEAG